MQASFTITDNAQAQCFSNYGPGNSAGLQRAAHWSAEKRKDKYKFQAKNLKGIKI
jgi:hypothetical protein